MVRKFMRTGLLAALGAVAVLTAYGATGTAGQEKKDDKIPDIKEIMQKGHKATDNYLDQIKAEVKGAKWEDAATHAKLLNGFGEALGKNKPSKGDDKSWKALCDKYAADTKAVLTAVEKKDADAANKAVGAIRGSCGGCHKAHK
jgi:cytochrome c556